MKLYGNKFYFRDIEYCQETTKEFFTNLDGYRITDAIYEKYES